MASLTSTEGFIKVRMALKSLRAAVDALAGAAGEEAMEKVFEADWTDEFGDPGNPAWTAINDMRHKLLAVVDETSAKVHDLAMVDNLKTH